MKKSSAALLAVAALGLCAAVWFLADSRDDFPYRLHEKGDYAAAIPELGKRAEQNDGKAQYYLGWIAIKQGDEKSGLAWWRKASDNGYGPATYNLGAAYLQGDYGLGQDIILAREWLQKALAQGGTSASEVLYDMERSLGPYYLHVLHEQGEAAAQVLAQQAPQWLERGILAGDRAGVLNLRYAYNCEGYPVNNAPALIAALQPMEERSGQNELLGMLYFAEEDYANALKHLEKSRAETPPSLFMEIAAYRMGRIYEEGLGVPRDAARARALYQSAGRDGSCKDERLAMWHLAMMQAQGRGGEVDKADAAALLARLEKAGSDPVYPQKTAWPTAEQLDALRAAIAAP